MNEMGKSRLATDGLMEYISPLAFALLILSIQMGVTYYLSVQTVAMLFMLVVLLRSRITLRITPIFVCTILLFSVMLLFTSFRHPEAISRSSPHILMTSIGVIGYVSLLLSMASISPMRSGPLLKFFRRCSAMTIVLIAILVLTTDLNAFPFLTREAFIRQNVDLVTNYAELSVVELDITNRKERGAELNIDLLYGEPSFLALVLFVCLVSYVIACRTRTSMEEKDTAPASIFLLIVGVTCLVYIKAFSGIFYALLFVSLTLGEMRVRFKSNNHTNVSLLAFALSALVLAVILTESLPYYLHRILTISDSQSAQQRFGILLNFLPEDYFFGLQSAGRMPSAGIHNGIIYLAMIAGIGGIVVIAYVLIRAMHMAGSSAHSALSVLAVVAVFSQNGAVLSPNKLVIISLLFGALCCTAALRKSASLTSCG